MFTLDVLQNTLETETELECQLNANVNFFMSATVGRWEKILITTIQMSFVLISSETGMKQHIQN